MISIILCTYNDQFRLVRAIPSCVGQVPGQELILVDDGSTAPTPPNVQALLAGSDVRAIKHPENRGLAAARNTGIAAARHEWVIVLDADDYFYPWAVAHLVEGALVGGADVVYGNVVDNGIDPRPGAADIVHRPKPQPWSLETFKQGNPLFCGSLFRKSLWERVGGYTVREGPDRLLYEDWRFWTQCFRAGARFHYVDVNVYYHTSRADGMLRKMHPDREHYRRITLEGLVD